MSPTFPDVVINASWISAAAGTFLTLLTSYIPGFNKMFASLNSAAKQLWMLLAIAVVTVIIGVLTFTHVLKTGLEAGGVIGLFILFIETVIANQAVYNILPQPQAVTIAKAARKTP